MLKKVICLQIEKFATTGAFEGVIVDSFYVAH